MPQGSSKEIQSWPAEAAYRFAGFELYPRERLLRRGNDTIPLQPKLFDALHCLVRRGESLVTKEELTRTLWPTVHVSEANLTNTIVALRKLIGYDAIRTVSKHGYRFVLPVDGEPRGCRDDLRTVLARQGTNGPTIACFGQPSS
jgi:DNA-binding winged helix-turn-helix (wHTH) protein